MAQKLRNRNPFTNEIRFTKVTGAGNDFILFDALNQVIPMVGEDAIQRLCRRGLGVGADGVLILSPSQKADFKLNYYNADGTSGMLCANGARCALLYAKNFFDIIEKEIKFECCGEIFSGEILEANNIKFNVKNVTEFKQTAILFQNIETEAFIANTGAPHVVFDFVKFKERSGLEEDFDSFNISRIGGEIRHNPAFEPDGINVNFIYDDGDKIKIRTYERGVENETLACGTGIVAAAIFLAETKGKTSPLNFVSKSEKNFTVEFVKEDGIYKNVSLTGEAQIVYYGEIIEDLIY